MCVNERPLREMRVSIYALMRVCENVCVCVCVKHVNVSLISINKSYFGILDFDLL